MRSNSAQSGQVFCLVLLLGCALLYAVGVAEDLPLGKSVSAEPIEGLPTDSDTSRSLEIPDQFVGPEGCVECHQAEYLIWSRTNHATNAYDLLRTSSNAKRYAAKLDLNSDRVTDNLRCLGCHSTPQSEADESTGLVLGVTCEACHNAAGGEDGWLNAHMTYGPNNTKRNEETAQHRKQRVDRCKSAGQNRCDDLYSLAKRCYECHVIGDEELVVRAGHHPGNAGFEMTSWFNKKIRHNVFLDPQHNGLAPSLWTDPHWRPNHLPGQEINHRRLMYVVAMLVDLEVSLRNRGHAKHASFASAAATRIVAATSRLTRIAKGQSLLELEEIISVVARLEPILFVPPAEKDSQSFLNAAQLISGIAKQISTEGQGERFPTVDHLLGPSSKRERLPEP